jgi:flavin-dependent dehydrogenase
MLLARAGARVALVDRGRYGSDILSTHGLMRAGVLQLTRWGLLPRIVAAGTPPIRATTFHYTDADPVRISIRPSAGVAALYAPRRQLLDRVLVDAAAAAGAEVRHETRVSDVLRDCSGRVSGARVVDASGARDLSARFVVGADGISSVVAREVGAATLSRGRWASAVQYAYYRGTQATGYEWAYGDGAAAGLIPTNDDLACVFVATTPERMRTLRVERTAEGTFHALLRLASPGLATRLARATRVGRQYGWAGRQGFIRRSGGPGWALVGDAGYFKDPISTHGLTDAMRDAELLAGAVLEGLSGAVPEDLALEAFQTRRDQLSAQLFQVSDEIAAYDWDGDEVQGLLRRVSAAMTDEVELLEALPTGAAGPSSGIRTRDGEGARR